MFDTYGVGWADWHARLPDQVVTKRLPEGATDGGGALRH